MKPNALRGVVAVVFVIAVIGAYLLGRGAGEKAATAELSEGAAGARGGSASGGPLSALESGSERRVGGDDTDGLPPGQAADVKSIIAKARAKMGGGMMNISGMMRALAMLDSIGDEQIAEALEEIERTVKEPQQKMMFAMVMLGRWAESDGPAALAYAEEHFTGKKNPMMQQVKMSVVSSWAQNDPDGAWKWYEEQDDMKGGMFGGRGMALMGIIGSLATKDVDLAFERIASIEDQQERQMALQGLGQAIWDEDRRAEILVKIGSMEDGVEKTQVRSSVLTQWTQLDPEGALEWAGTLEEEERSAAVKQIAQSMSWSDPERSGELLLSEAKTPEERTHAYSNTISSWAFNDPNAAGEWLGKQDQGPELDQARQQFANSIAQKDPESAMAWANAVSDDKMREGAVQSVYTQWANKDREAANAALGQTELSEEKVAELQEMDLPKVSNAGLGGVFYGASTGAVIVEEKVEEKVEATHEHEEAADPE